MQALPLTDSERSWHPSNSDLNLSKQEPPEGSDASAVTARMDALTKLTDRPNEHPDRNISLVNPESTDSWRSFLPRNDPLLAGRDNNSSALTDETQESWRSFLAVPTTLPDAKDTHDIFFGPPENPIPIFDDESEDCPIVGRRADLFVRRYSMSPIGNPRPRLWDTSLPMQPRLQQPPIVCEPPEMMESTRSHPRRQSTGMHDMFSPLLGDGSLSPISSSNAEEDRTLWPTSSRRSQSDHPYTSNFSFHSRLGVSPAAVRSESDLLPVRPVTESNERLGMRNKRIYSSTDEHNPPILSLITHPSARQQESGLDASNFSHDSRVSLEKTPNAYSITLHVPGYTLDGITMATKGHNRRTLHVIANRWGSDRLDHFERRITFPSDARMCAIRARFENEHLFVHVPRFGATMETCEHMPVESQRDLDTEASSATDAGHQDIARSSLF